MPNTTVAVHVSDETANKLFMAYVGMSTVRQSAIDERVKKDGVSRQQATLDEILNPRVAIYAKRGEEQQEQIMAQARAILTAQGRTKEQIDSFLSVAAK